MLKILLPICHNCLLRAGGICTENGRGIKENIAVRRCPKAKFPRPPQASAGQPPVENIPEQEQAKPQARAESPWGPAMWAELHTAKEMDEPKFMAWCRRVPCGLCAVGLMASFKEMPPVYHDDGVLDWEWGWRLHNAVNAKLGKPQFTLAEARARWDQITLSNCITP